MEGEYPEEPGEGRRWYQRTLRDRRSRQFIIETRDGLAIGDIALGEISWRAREAELRIRIGEKAYWNRGTARRRSSSSSATRSRSGPRAGLLAGLHLQPSGDPVLLEERFPSRRPAGPERQRRGPQRDSPHDGGAGSSGPAPGSPVLIWRASWRRKPAPQPPPDAARLVGRQAAPAHALHLLIHAQRPGTSHLARSKACAQGDGSPRPGRDRLSGPASQTPWPFLPGRCPTHLPLSFSLHLPAMTTSNWAL